MTAAGGEGHHDDEARRLVCRCYTRGRRHPLVVGRIGGWVLPTPLSPAQLLAGLATFSLLAAGGGLWQPALPPAGRLVVLAGAPVAAGWAIRHARVEGRSPLAAAAGWLRLVLSPPGGVVAGRPQRRARTVRLHAPVTVQTTAPRTGPAAVLDVAAAPPPAVRPSAGSPYWPCLGRQAGG